MNGKPLNLGINYEHPMGMNNRKLTFLLGAGASFGHLKDIKTPPIMSNFLSRSVKEGVLIQKDFPALVNYCIKDQDAGDIFEACQNIEKNSNLEKFLSKIKDTWVLHLALVNIKNA